MSPQSNKNNFGVSNLNETNKLKGTSLSFSFLVFTDLTFHWGSQKRGKFIVPLSKLKKRNRGNYGEPLSPCLLIYTDKKLIVEKVFCFKSSIY